MKKGFLVLVFLCSLSIFSSTSRAGITTKFFMGAPQSVHLEHKLYWDGIWKGIYYANAAMGRLVQGKKLFCPPKNFQTGDIDAIETITKFLESNPAMVNDKLSAELIIIFAVMDMFPCNYSCSRIPSRLFTI